MIKKLWFDLVVSKLAKILLFISYESSHMTTSPSSTFSSGLGRDIARDVKFDIDKEMRGKQRSTHEQNKLGLLALKKALIWVSFC